MTLQELTSHLQTLCHEGHSQEKVMIENLQSRFFLEHTHIYTFQPEGGIPFVLIKETAE